MNIMGTQTNEIRLPPPLIGTLISAKLQVLHIDRFYEQGQSVQSAADDKMIKKTNIMIVFNVILPNI